jgi:predicted MFS family arabinose efflux permease
MAIQNLSSEPGTIQDSKLRQPDEKGTSISTPDVESVELQPQPPFSVFTKWQKRWINFLTSFAAMFSTLSSYIYYPALVPVAKDLGVSIFLINLTVTSYLIIAAVAPAFMGDMADQSGRRPIYILMFTLYLAANLGIALQKSFPALLVLRMLQSAGSSGKFNTFHKQVRKLASKTDNYQD